MSRYTARFRHGDERTEVRIDEPTDAAARAALRETAPTGVDVDAAVLLFVRDDAASS